LPRRVTREALGEWSDILEPLWNAVEDVGTRIAEYDRKIEQLLQKYPAAVRRYTAAFLGMLLQQQISGVGPLISLTFVLTLDDHMRFKKSRQIGSFVGLRPRQRDSGESQPQLRITKAGDRYLRSLLIQGAQYILGKFGPDTDLRRWGLKLAERGGKNQKKRAVVAVARKLAVLMHRLWADQSVYQPLRQGC
jgi:transposase